MLWKDFFYFSKGERTALIVLLILILLACGLLFYSDRQKEIQTANAPVVVDTIRIAAETIEKDHLPEQKTSAKQPSKKSKESVPERIDRLQKTYKPYIRQEKFPAGTVVELNGADTTTLKKIPGIGSAFSNRIVKYRNLLGGYYSVNQLKEVYGMDDERFESLKDWFYADSTLIRKTKVNALSFSSLLRHPYLDYDQTRRIVQVRKRYGFLKGWENLQLLKEFTEEDRNRLLPYLSFERNR